MQDNIEIGLMPLEARLNIIEYTALRAEALGYRGFALPETWAYSVPVVLAHLAAQTQQIGLSTGILGIWGRTAATIAMTAATLQQVSSGRFSLGLGASTPQLTEGLHDIPFEKPYSQLRQRITQIRALLSGERIPLEAGGGRPLKLNLEPQPEIPIVLAASSEKSIKLVGELCDGWLPYLYPRDRLLDAMALIDSQKESSFDPSRKIRIMASVPTVVAPNEALARAGAAWFLAFYLTTMGTIYRDSLSRLGFEKEVKSVMEANAGQQPSEVPADAEVLLEQLTIYGTPDQVQQRLATWYVHEDVTPALLFAPNLDEAAIDFTLNAFVAQ